MKKTKLIANWLLQLRLKALVGSSELSRGKPAQVKNILFVIGTGRSGTHFLTQCLTKHPRLTDFTGGKENPLVFDAITQAALDQSRALELLPQAEKIYDALALLASPDWLVDQSHPNIWFAEHWARNYPAAHFVGIIRNPFSVVASMMKHAGVSAWALRWERYPVPNPFLGITAAEAYGHMSLAERCTLRWISHYRRLNDLIRTLGKKLSIVVYEDLCRDPHRHLSNIFEKLGLTDHFTVPRVDRDALTRGSSMSATDIAAIEQLLIKEQVDPRWRRAPWRLG